MSLREDPPGLARPIGESHQNPWLEAVIHECSPFSSSKTSGSPGLIRWCPDPSAWPDSIYFLDMASFSQLFFASPEYILCISLAQPSPHTGLPLPSTSQDLPMNLLAQDSNPA